MIMRGPSLIQNWEKRCSKKCQEEGYNSIIPWPQTNLQPPFSHICKETSPINVLIDHSVQSVALWKQRIHRAISGINSYDLGQRSMPILKLFRTPIVSNRSGKEIFNTSLYILWSAFYFKHFQVVLSIFNCILICFHICFWKFREIYKNM